MARRLRPPVRLLRLFKRAGIRETIRTSYIVIIGLTLVAPVMSLTASWLQTARYDRVITNVSKTNRLNQIVRIEISDEIWDIVAGNKDFAEGRQYEIIADIGARIADIKRGTTVTENRQMIEVANRAMDTLTNCVDRLGRQMEALSPVTENEKLLDEIRGVAALVSDILQDFIVLEIESAASTNEQLKQTAVLLTVLQILMVLFVTLFAVFAQRTVADIIHRPISELEKLSSRIAAGNFEARAEPPHVRELDRLTENLNTMAAKLRELIDANIREQQNLQKSEMKALQAQITPHFLYNTLDTIVWLAEGHLYDQVILVTRNFSSFFRRSLSRGKDWVAVHEELEHVQNYLTIQKIRYRDILDYSIECDPAMADRPMLKLLLQPLVENALYHGIKNKRGRGMITVRGWREDGFLCFRVNDNGIGMTQERLAAIGEQIDGTLDSSTLSDVYGLYNVNKRLALYYSGAAKLSISSVYREGTSVSFRLPETEHHV